MFWINRRKGHLTEDMNRMQALLWHGSLEHRHPSDSLCVAMNHRELTRKNRKHYVSRTMFSSLPRGLRNFTVTG